MKPRTGNEATADAIRTLTFTLEILFASLNEDQAVNVAGDCHAATDELLAALRKHGLLSDEDVEAAVAAMEARRVRRARCFERAAREAK